MVPTVFQAGNHTVSVSVGTGWRWSVTVDGGPLPGSHETQVAAWEAGVREADRLDRLPGAER
jgi:hypothetical protein